jgi:choline-sulfatase
MPRGAAIGIAAIVAALAGFAWIYFGRAFSIERRANQNVLLITIDSLRADALGSYGGRALTPNLDRLAGEGLRFDAAQADATSTRPSHATLATILKQHGFATAAFVGGEPFAKRFGFTAGFDVYDDRFDAETNTPDVSIAERPAGAVIEPALAWIRAHQGGRWFVWVYLFDPHPPYAPPPPFDREYVRMPYLGEVAYVDQALRPLLDTVRGGPRPTLVLVTSDHGEAVGDSTEPTKGSSTDGSALRVPLIITQVSNHPSHRAVSHVPARQVDILPTVLDAVDAPAPAGLPGRSLLPGSRSP